MRKRKKTIEKNKKICYNAKEDATEGFGLFDLKYPKGREGNMNDRKREEISLEIADHYAHPSLLGLPPTNPWECIRCEEKTATLQRLDETLAGRSDYEAFALWEQMRPLSVGTGILKQCTGTAVETAVPVLVRNGFLW